MDLTGQRRAPYVEHETPSELESALWEYLFGAIRGPRGTHPGMLGEMLYPDAWGRRPPNPDLLRRPEYQWELPRDTYGPDPSLPGFFGEPLGPPEVFDWQLPLNEGALQLEPPNLQVPMPEQALRNREIKRTIGR
jgi:hypothetical protein